MFLAMADKSFDIVVKFYYTLIAQPIYTCYY